MTGIPLRGPPTPMKPRLYPRGRQSQHIFAPKGANEGPTENSPMLFARQALKRRDRFGPTLVDSLRDREQNDRFVCTRPVCLFRNLHNSVDPELLLTLRVTLRKQHYRSCFAIDKHKIGNMALCAIHQFDSSNMPVDIVRDLFTHRVLYRPSP